MGDESNGRGADEKRPWAGDAQCDGRVLTLMFLLKKRHQKEEGTRTRRWRLKEPNKKRRLSIHDPDIVKS